MSEVKYLSKSAIQKARSATTAVHVPEWKDETGAEYVCVQSLSAIDRSEYIEHCNKAHEAGNATMLDIDARLAALGMVDPETREPLLTLDDLKTKEAVIVGRIADAARKLSGIGAGAVEAAKEDLGKVPSDGSTTS